MQKTIEFLEKAKKVHGDRYNYDKVEYIHCREQVIIQCNIHGEFKQTPSVHLGGAGCSACARDSAGHKNRATKKDFLRKAKETHGDKYDYTQVEYKGINKKVTIICPDHGIFNMTPKSHYRGSGCRECANLRVKAKSNKRSKIKFFERLSKMDIDLDLSLINYKDSTTKVRVRCKEHGVIEVYPHNLLRKKGCTKCYHEKLKTEIDEFIKRAKEIHNGIYNYDAVNYVNSKTKVQISCSKHGIFEQIPNSHLLGFGCEKCGNESTAEKIRVLPIELERLVSKVKGAVKDSYLRRKYRKNTKTSKILGCEWDEFKEYLENNPYGFTTEERDLDLDHIIPISSAKTEEDVYKLNHYTNFQLLPHDYNCYIKRDKPWDVDHFEEWLNSNIK